MIGLLPQGALEVLDRVGISFVFVLLLPAQEVIERRLRAKLLGLGKLRPAPALSPLSARHAAFLMWYAREWLGLQPSALSSTLSARSTLAAPGGRRLGQNQEHLVTAFLDLGLLFARERAGKFAERPAAVVSVLPEDAEGLFGRLRVSSRLVGSMSPVNCVSRKSASLRRSRKWRKRFWTGRAPAVQPAERFRPRWPVRLRRA